MEATITIKLTNVTDKMDLAAVFHEAKEALNAGYADYHPASIDGKGYNGTVDIDWVDEE